MTLYDHLDEIRKKPGLYLGDATLTSLWHYLDGYGAACREHGIDERLDPPFEGFNDFVANTLRRTAVAGWRNIILADNFGQEEQALREFFKLLDAFRAGADMDLALRVLQALLTEMLFNQHDWRSKDPAAFDTILVDCREQLMAIKTGQLFTPELVLTALEEKAKTREVLAKLLVVAHQRASAMKGANRYE